MKKLKGLICVLCIFSMSTTVFAVTQGYETISAQIRNDFTIKIDGVTSELKDSNKKSVYPFVYEGITYLPLRSIAELTNNNISWNGEKNEIDVCSKKEDIDLFTLFENIEYPEHFSFDKFEYSNNTIKIYLNENEIVTWSRALETIAFQVYDKFSNIECIEFETSLPSEKLTKVYTNEWYRYQIGS